MNTRTSLPSNSNGQFGNGNAHLDRSFLTLTDSFTIDTVVVDLLSGFRFTGSGPNPVPSVAIYSGNQEWLLRCFGEMGATARR